MWFGVTNPVEVLMKSTPVSSANLAIVAFSGSVKALVSIITFKILSPTRSLSCLSSF